MLLGEEALFLFKTARLSNCYEIVHGLDLSDLVPFGLIMFFFFTLMVTSPILLLDIAERCDVISCGRILYIFTSPSS